MTGCPCGFMTDLLGTLAKLARRQCLRGLPKRRLEEVPHRLGDAALARWRVARRSVWSEHVWLKSSHATTDQSAFSGKGPSLPLVHSFLFTPRSPCFPRFRVPKLAHQMKPFHHMCLTFVSVTVRPRKGHSTPYGFSACAHQLDGCLLGNSSWFSSHL